MKRLLLLIGLVVWSTGTGWAQTTEPLSRRPAGTFSPVRFFLGEQRISRRKVGTLLQNENPPAYEEFRRARAAQALSQVTGLPGGFLLGYGVGGLVSGERVNGVQVGLGAGLLVLSYVLRQKEESHLERAVALHNQRAGRLRLDLGPAAQGGLGVQIRF